MLVILQLCRVALPIMSASDCELIELPSWGNHVTSGDRTQSDGKALMIAHLLLAKLADFLVPGAFSGVTPMSLAHKIMYLGCTK